jgi:hypothetical protein
MVGEGTEAVPMGGASLMEVVPMEGTGLMEVVLMGEVGLTVAAVHQGGSVRLLHSRLVHH